VKELAKGIRGIGQSQRLRGASSGGVAAASRKLFALVTSEPECRMMRTVEGRMCEALGDKVDRSERAALLETSRYCFDDRRQLDETYRYSCCRRSVSLGRLRTTFRD
jgi:hypothetical protein